MAAVRLTMPGGPWRPSISERGPEPDAGIDRRAAARELLRRVRFLVAVLL
jgi:hypothetical protein